MTGKRVTGAVAAGGLGLWLAFATAAAVAADSADSANAADSAAAADSAMADSVANSSAFTFDFEASYDRYLEAERNHIGREEGADPVLVIEAQALAMEAESLAAVGELEQARSLLEEAIAILDGAIVPPRGGRRQDPGAGSRRSRFSPRSKGLRLARPKTQGPEHDWCGADRCEALRPAAL